MVFASPGAAKKGRFNWGKKREDSNMPRRSSHLNADIKNINTVPSTAHGEKKSHPTSGETSATS